MRPKADKQLKNAKPPDMLSATVSFTADDECRMLRLRADHEQRAVSQLGRPLLRDVLQTVA
jgi:hypothetical protein